MTSTNIKPVDKKELDSMLQKAIEQVENVGIKVPTNIKSKIRTYKATSYFGQCRKKEGQFEITISEYHLKNGYNAVMETMIHEVIHTVDGCWNHGELWKRCVDKVNRKYGYSISRTGSQKQGYSLKVAEVNVKYIIKCDKCGNTIQRQRMSKLVKYPEIYRCKCGGKLSRIK